MVQVVVTADFPAGLVDQIRSVGAEIEVELMALTDGRWPAERQTMAEVIYATSAVPRPDQAPNLRWIQTHYAGIESLMDSPVWNTDIQITSASGIHAPNVAQYAMTQMLAWAHRVPRWLATQQAGEWPRQRWDTFLPQELRGATLGIIGYGSIGRELARLAKPFGMRILASKRDARSLEDTGYALTNTGDPRGELPDRVYPGEALRSLVAECDFVVLTLPLTARTHHLFHEAIFRQMKPTSYLVNVGRGGLINEKDLVQALNRRWIAGAGLDVFETEPLPASSPLWQMENVILTPHVSGFTPAYDERAVDLFVTNLRRYRAGEPLLNVVDRDRGY